MAAFVMVLVGAILAYPDRSAGARIIIGGLLLAGGIIISFDWLLKAWSKEQPWDAPTARYAKVAALTIAMALASSAWAVYWWLILLNCC